MFWSKIWYFLVAVAAVIALVVALAIPRPAERRSVADQNRRVKDACSVVGILLAKRASMRVNRAMFLSVVPSLNDTLQNASRPAAISPQLNRTARETARRHPFKKTDKPDPLRPDFVIFLDKNGRVVARVTDTDDGAKIAGVDPKEYGDSLAGYSLVEDALNGFMRDDLWLIKGALFRLAAAPVVANGYTVGAVITGLEVDQEFAKRLADQLGVRMSFYAGERAVANSDPEVQIHKDIVTAVKAREETGSSWEQDCFLAPIQVQASAEKSFLVSSARLPGEAGIVQKAFYSVYIEQPAPMGIGAIKDKDLAFGSFPWVSVGGLLLLAIGIGFGVMIWEADRPLRRLAKDALDLSKGNIEKLNEDVHPGRFGSIARSVNIQLDKQEQATKAAKSDLDQLLGPGEDGVVAMGAFDASGASSFDASGASALPSVGPGTSLEAFAAPPPSEFKFSDAPAPMKAGEFEFDLPGAPAGGAASGVPQAERSGPVSSAPINTHVAPAAISIPESIDEDILGRPAQQTENFDPEATVISNPSQELLDASGGSDSEGNVRKVYDEFLALKRKCGEPTDTLTLERFSAKIQKNRATLIAKHSCRDVRFQVYIKNGKAALRATPVK